MQGLLDAHGNLLIDGSFGRDSRDDADGRARRLYEVGGSHLQLQTAFAGTHVDVRKLHCGFVNENGEVLLEAERAATAADVAGKRSQVFQRDGIDFLVAADFRGAFQVNFEITGHDAHEVTDLVAVNKDGLENLIDIFAEAVGYMLRAQVAFVDLVGNKFVRNFLAVENSCRVRLLDIHVVKYKSLRYGVQWGQIAILRGMDTLVYTADISALNDPAVFERLLGAVPEYRREKAMRFKFPGGRMQSLGVGLLLKQACRDAGIDGADEDVVLGENGKPAFRNHPEIHFNLSHSKTRVMCVLSPYEAGCDVEHVRVGRSRLAERFFKESETQWIHSFPEGEAQDEAFCRLWTLKECYMKVTGRGMALSPDKFTLSVTSEGILLNHDGPRPEYTFREISRDDGFRYAYCLKGMLERHCVVCREIDLTETAPFKEVAR